MSRPLLITDCDEVLLHMVSPFAGYLDEAHDIDFDPASGDFSAVYRRSDGSQLAHHEVWPLLDRFFNEEMHRQQPVPGAVEALEEIGAVADIRRLARDRATLRLQLRHDIPQDVLRSRHQHDLRTGPRCRPRGGEADARTGAGDDDDLFGEWFECHGHAGSFGRCCEGNRARAG